VIILKDIYKVAIEAVSGSKEVAVHKIEFDSRKIEVNDVLSLFVVLFQTGMIIFKKAIELEQ
jgi:UDP-N-acetylmuramoyl-L-alanyl-D-glutamate--2,6-diaminopimelate ligase